MKKYLILVITILGIHSSVLAATLSVGKQAPAFSLPSVTSKKVVSLNDFTGKKPVVIGLFHICDPCREQTLQLQQVQNTINDKAAVIAINTAGNEPDEVKDFLKTVKTAVTFPFLITSGVQLDSAYNVRMTPAVIIVDKSGKVVFQGYSVSAATLVDELKKYSD